MDDLTTTKNDQKSLSTTRAISLESSSAENPNLDGDRLNFYLLLLLYIIQGFPLGLSYGYSLTLQSRKMISYEDQAIFSINVWPYILNILWAPIVDAFYVQRIGRRKCWLIPLQLLSGLLLFYMAINIADWLPVSGKPNLKMLVTVCFVLNLISSTQDIVVDGWALTMLKKKNVSYASTCNSVGVTFGIFIGSVCFVLLVSEEFSIKVFRAVPGTKGLITMKSFILFWAIFIVSVTLLVGMFKHEKNNIENYNEKISIFQNYKLLWDMSKLPNIRGLAIAILTSRIGFIPMESISDLKLIDSGVSKDYIMIISTLMVFVQLAAPIFVPKYNITSIKPMSFYLKMTPIRLFWGVIYATFIYFTSSIIHLDNGIVDVPMYYYLMLGFVYLVNAILGFFMLMTVFSFFYQISDPRFGGTYMTLFNTFYFFGWFVPNTLVLKTIDVTTFSKCSNDVHNLCSTPDLTSICKTNGGSCIVYVDGYYITTCICTVLGIVWYCTFKNTLRNYETLSLSHWTAYFTPPSTDEVKEPCIMSPTPI